MLFHLSHVAHEDGEFVGSHFVDTAESPELRLQVGDKGGGVGGGEVVMNNDDSSWLCRDVDLNICCTDVVFPCSKGMSTSLGVRPCVVRQGEGSTFHTITLDLAFVDVHQERTKEFQFRKAVGELATLDAGVNCAKSSKELVLVIVEGYADVGGDIDL